MAETQVQGMPISKIQFAKTIDGSNPVINIGAAAEDVYITLDIGGQSSAVKLSDFANYLYDYFKNGTFISYGEQEPQSPNVKVWYDTNPSEE